jgi:hypothetical protein
VVVAGSCGGSQKSHAEVDVSHASGAQSEVAVAVDPRSTRTLVAGSNDDTGPTMRAYGSTDGGSTWSSKLAPPLPSPGDANCTGDPGVAIDGRGRQYFSFLWIRPCAKNARVEVFVATRNGPRASWRTPLKPVSPAVGVVHDDKPFIAVDNSASSPHKGRVYVVWSRSFSEQERAIMISHSDDGARRWSTPLNVSSSLGFPVYASVATGPRGDVYVVWDQNLEEKLLIRRSSDGGNHFGTERMVAPSFTLDATHCHGYSSSRIPASPNNCVRPNPVVVVDTSNGTHSGRVYVTYGTAIPGGNGSQDVFVAGFNAHLRGVLGSPATDLDKRVNPPDGKTRSDQFWPAPAVDPSTGFFWVCFYDTTGDPRRVRTHFVCTASSDGGKTWRPPVRAASVASDETQRRADNNEYGDYEGLVAAHGVAHPLWTDSRKASSLREEIYTTGLPARLFAR